MTRAITIIGLLLLLTTLGGCATVTRGTTEALVINSQPPGAEVQITNGMRCKTPCTLEVKRKKDLVLTFEKAGYEPLQTTVVSEIAGAGAAGMAGNVILGGLIGAGVDAATGATKKLTPNPINVTLTPVQVQTATLPPPAPEALKTISIEEMCDQVAKIDRLQCRGDLKLGMDRSEVERLLGPPDARSPEGRGARYGDRNLTFDDTGHLIEIITAPVPVTSTQAALP